MTETRREKAAADARFEAEAEAREMERAMGPDYSRKGIFQTHSCAYCRDGELPCKQGGAHRCDNPRARND